MSAPAAIILAAGVGKRFGGELGDRPKALLEVGGETLVGRILRQLRAAGVERIAVVVGWGGDAIAEHLADAGVEIVRNPDFRRGAILSLWCARHLLDGDVLVMDADVFCPDEAILRLVRSPHESCFLLDGRATASGEEQMLHVRGGLVRDIARRPRGEHELLGESIGFLKLSSAAARLLRDLMRDRIERGDVDLEHEEVYPDLLARVDVGYERADDFEWTEIDFPDDLARARAIAARRARPHAR
ncbi:MAG TPA: phosphocholine cytidylyltransferase family protein [Candidatus Binatia bacterium]|nr:phosphocholine cytidylyltransferase family protein [Candidatus Binatia bacterium]